MHLHPVLALVTVYGNMGFPLAAEVSLFGLDALGGSEDGVAANVLVALLDEAEAGFVPHDAVL